MMKKLYARRHKTQYIHTNKHTKALPTSSPRMIYSISSNTILLLINGVFTYSTAAVAAAATGVAGRRLAMRSASSAFGRLGARVFACMCTAACTPSRVHVSV